MIESFSLLVRSVKDVEASDVRDSLVVLVLVGSRNPRDVEERLSDDGLGGGTGTLGLVKLSDPLLEGLSGW